jgi:hypothetical protein
MMDCRKTQRVLVPGDIMRVSDTVVEAALLHAQDCESCGSLLEHDRRVAQLIRDAVPRVRAPRELRERLYTALARERAGAGTRGSGGRRFSWAVTVAAILIVGGAVSAAGHWLVGRGGSTPSATAFAEDYLRRVVEQVELQSTDRHEIGAFFARELGVSMPPPEVPGYELARATICLMNGRRGGVVEYSAAGRSFSYYVVPLDREGVGGRSDIDVRLVGDDSAWLPAVRNERGLGVATWWDGEHRHALVGNLTVVELERLAPLFSSPTSRL